jgi:hypothetical protein
MPDDPDTLGRIVHDTRRSFGATLDRPMTPAPWEERHPRQQELDRQIGAAVEAAVRERVAGELDRLALLQVPGVVREAWREAAAAVRKGGKDQERGEEKEADRGQH